MSEKFDVFAKMSSEESIENGAWLHFKDADGEPVYRDAAKTKPCKALVRSYRCKAFRGFSVLEEARNSGKITRAKDSAKDELQATIAKSRRYKWLFILLNGLENCGPTPGIVTLTEDECREFCEQSINQIAVEQILEFAFEDKNYGVAGANPPVAGEAAGD